MTEVGNIFRDVDAEAVALWTKTLRYGDLTQVRGTISMWVSDLDGHKTLAGVCAVGAGMYAMGDTTPGGGSLLGASEPREFVEWLGGGAFFDEEAPVTVCIDWPDDALDPVGLLYMNDADMISIVGLNDSLDLTFEQIADVIDYFGIVLR